MLESTPVLSRPIPNVARIRLNRPTNANRIQPEDLSILEQQLEECEQDASIHVLVLGATGGYFSAGYDLRALTSTAKTSLTRANESDSAFEKFANRLEQSRLIVIGAINGPVLGGATDLALACDIRLGSSTTYMLMPAARFGLPLYAGALQRYVSRLGINNAKQLVFLAQRANAEEMLSMGFLNKVVDPQSLDNQALEVAARIAEMPSGPLSAMKHVLNAAALSQGNAQPQREALAAAFDGPAIAARIAESQAIRRSKQ